MSVRRNRIGKFLFRKFAPDADPEAFPERMGGAARFRGPLEGCAMKKGCLLWLLGVPIPVIIVLWLLFGR